MPSPAFRSMTAATGGAGDTVTLPPPAGLANDDILIGILYAEPASQGVVPPLGFTSFARIESASFTSELFWKRAASESGDYLFVEAANAWGDGSLYAVSGCITTETPIGTVGADNTGTDISAEALGITTTTANSLLCYVAVNFDGLNMDANGVPTMTERFDNDNEYLADLALATAQATGTKTGNWETAMEWHALLFELKSEAAGAGRTTKNTHPWTLGVNLGIGLGFPGGSVS